MGLPLWAIRFIQVGYPLTTTSIPSEHLTTYMSTPLQVCYWALLGCIGALQGYTRKSGVAKGGGVSLLGYQTKKT